MKMKKINLEPYQQEGVAFLVSRYHALLADEMGLGKTVQTIEAINRLDAKAVLIICPQAVTEYWAQALKEQLMNRYLKIKVVYSVADTAQGWDIYILSYNLLTVNKAIFTALYLKSYDVGICDEAHYLQSVEAKRTKLILGTQGIIRKCKYKYMLTGTPMPNRPRDLYPMLRTLANSRLTPYNSFDSYARRFCGAYWDGYQLVATGATNTADLADRLEGFMLRRTRLLDKPKGLEYCTVEFFKDFTGSAQEVGLEKVQDIIAYVKDSLKKFDEDKYIIFCYHRSVIKLLAEFFKADVLIGGMSAKQKAEVVNRFRTAKESRVLIGQIQACCEGIDGLQHVCNRIIFAEPTWSVKDVNQAIGRVFRKFQTKTVYVEFLVIKHSIDEVIQKSRKRKEKAINKILERGGE